MKDRLEFYPKASKRQVYLSFLNILFFSFCAFEFNLWREPPSWVLFALMAWISFSLLRPSKRYSVILENGSIEGFDFGKMRRVKFQIQDIIDVGTKPREFKPSLKEHLNYYRRFFLTYKDGRIESPLNDAQSEHLIYEIRRLL